MCRTRLNPKYRRSKGEFPAEEQVGSADGKLLGGNTEGSGGVWLN